MPKWLFLIVSSRSVRRQPEKLGHWWWTVWNKVLPGDRCWQSGELVDQVCQRHEWVVPGIAARYREELCSSVLQSYTVCAPGPAASEGWWVRLWCGRSVSDRFRLKRNGSVEKVTGPVNQESNTYSKVTERGVFHVKMYCIKISNNQEKQQTIRQM